MPNDFEEQEQTSETVADEKRNPLAAPPVGEAAYSQLEDGKWVGIISMHPNHQFQAKGVTQDECEAKIKSYLERE